MVAEYGFFSRKMYQTCWRFESVLTVNVEGDPLTDSRRNVIASDAEVRSHLLPVQLDQVQTLAIVRLHCETEIYIWENEIQFETQP